MPWCPKCGSEYRDDFTVCADCGCELISEEEYAKLEAERAAAEEMRLAEEMRIRYEALTGQRKAGTEVCAAESAFSSAKEETPGMPEEAEWSDSAEGSVFAALSGSASGLSKNTGSDSASVPAAGNSAAESMPLASGGMMYQDSAERASENRSSAWILLILGGLGIIGVMLGIAGVLPLNFGNSYLFYGVMSAVFILFIVSGIISMKNALVFDKKAQSENSLRDTILKWCEENLNGAKLDERIEISEDMSEEILYFRRFEKIRDRLNYQFVNLDQDFLERFIDDCIYDMVFPQQDRPGAE